MNDQGHVFLVGFMGSGKSTVGRMVSRQLRRPFVDCDERIERSAGSSVSEIFACDGEDAFREMETAVLLSLRSANPSVVACGGGAVLREENRTLMSQEGQVVYLRVTYSAALDRISDPSTRPLLTSSANPESLLDQRTALYESVADFTVDTMGKSAAEVANEVVRLLGSRS